ncbi:MAG: DUF4214 domain-containing protein [Acetatifactor sp.]|nr:DUF4214 domain-containing protein [Acetatifactor sp.]
MRRQRLLCIRDRGKSDWVGRLSAGASREEVLEGFSRSKEFAGILAGYGL